MPLTGRTLELTRLTLKLARRTLELTRLRLERTWLARLPREGTCLTWRAVDRISSGVQLLVVGDAWLVRLSRRRILHLSRWFLWLRLIVTLQRWR